MKRKFWIIMALFLVLPGLLLTTSCAKKAVQKMETADTGKSTEVKTEPAKDGDDAAKKLEEERLAKERERQLQEQRFLNEHVYFDFDKYDLKPMAVEVLKFKTKWLMDNPGVSVVVEGHCDERGTEEYNLALGDRRANSIKKFLMDSGITEARLSTISYGEESPLDPRHTEEAWAKNRRGQVKIK